MTDFYHSACKFRVLNCEEVLRKLICFWLRGWWNISLSGVGFGLVQTVMIMFIQFHMF